LEIVIIICSLHQVGYILDAQQHPKISKPIIEDLHEQDIFSLISCFSSYQSQVGLEDLIETCINDVVILLTISFIKCILLLAINLIKFEAAQL
jgi:hypothetical protein